MGRGRPEPETGLIPVYFLALPLHPRLISTLTVSPFLLVPERSSPRVTRRKCDLSVKQNKCLLNIYSGPQMS